jgi:hypothetical protein
LSDPHLKVPCLRIFFSLKRLSALWSKKLPYGRD